MTPYLPHEVLRFQKKITQTEDGCWVWTSHKWRFKVGGRQIYPRRFAFIHWRGAIPRGQVVICTCQTKNCVNPFHLELTTYSSILATVKQQHRRKRDA